MDQLKKLYAGLSLKQKISIGAAALLLLGAILGFAKWRRAQDFKPLYTGVAAEDAAAIIQKSRRAALITA